MLPIPKSAVAHSTISLECTYHGGQCQKHISYPVVRASQPHQNSSLLKPEAGLQGRAGSKKGRSSCLVFLSGEEAPPWDPSWSLSAHLRPPHKRCLQAKCQVQDLGMSSAMPFSPSLCIYRSRFCVCGVSPVQFSAVMGGNGSKSVFQDETTQPEAICHIFQYQFFSFQNLLFFCFILEMFRIHEREKNVIYWAPSIPVVC